MKKMKLLLLSSVTAAAVACPAFMQSAKAADKTISVKLSNYVGSKSSLDVDITGGYEIPGSRIADTERYGGATRFDVANNVASAGWTNPTTVLIVNRDAFADALSATPLAKKYDAPILLTDADSLTPKTESEATFAAFIKRLRDGQGQKVQGVTANYAGDYEGIINVTEGVLLEDGTEVTPDKATAWVAGASAGATFNQSLTFVEYEAPLMCYTALTTIRLLNVWAKVNFYSHSTPVINPSA